MPFNSGLAPNVVKTALDLVFQAEYDYPTMPGVATAETPLVFMQDSTDRQAVITEQFMGTGYWEERAENKDVHQSTARVGNQKTFPVLNFADSVDISKNLFDDDQHSTVETMMRNFARNARLSRDRNAFKGYYLGFSTVLTNDGQPLFSNSHVTLSGDTVDNLLTDVLAEPSLYDAVVALTLQKTQDGTLGGHEPAALIVAPKNFKKAMEITKSELKSGTANNDLNYYSQVYPGMQVFQSPFLATAYGGNDDAWYVVSRNHSLYRWVRQDVLTTLVDWKFQRNNSYIYKGELRETVGPISYEGLVASNGTT